MRLSEQIENVVKKMSFKAGPEMDQQIWADASRAQEGLSKTRSVLAEPEIWRTIMRNRLTKLIAAAVVVVGVFIGISYILKDHHGGIAFADVVKEMQQIRTATWTEIGESHPPKNLPQGAIFVGGSHIRRCAYKAPGYERQDTTQTLVDPQTRQSGEYKTFHIIDRNKGKALLLNPQNMTASLASFEAGAFRNPLCDVFLCPTSNVPRDAQSLGTKQIGDREAIGFRLLKKNDGTYPWSGDITDIWVDAKTRLLVMLETKAADDSWLFRLADFVFNEDLDDSLFSIEPPANYTQTEPHVISVTTTKEGN